MLANRAIYNHRTKFFKLDPQEKRCKLIIAAKTLAKLAAVKNRAHYKLVRASKPKATPETKSLLKWKNPAGGSQALLMQSFKMSQLCQPLQLPFQLLWPPDPISAESQPPEKQQFQKQPLKIGVQTQPLQLPVQFLWPPDPAPQPNDQPPSSVSQPPAANERQIQPQDAAKRQVNQPPVVVKIQDQPHLVQPPDLPPDPDPDPAPNPSQTKMGLRY